MSLRLLLRAHVRGVRALPALVLLVARLLLLRGRHGCVLRRPARRGGREHDGGEPRCEPASTRAGGRRGGDSERRVGERERRIVCEPPAAATERVRVVVVLLFFIVHDQFQTLVCMRVETVNVDK